MSACKQCGLPIRWEKDGERWKCLNPDGSDHWDRCSEERTKRALREGTPFEDRVGDGVVYNEKKRYMHIGCDSIRGPRYRPDGCNCGRPPWELCATSCQHAIGAPK